MRRRSSSCAVTTFPTIAASDASYRWRSCHARITIQVTPRMSRIWTECSMSASGARTPRGPSRTTNSTSSQPAAATNVAASASSRCFTTASHGCRMHVLLPVSGMSVPRRPGERPYVGAEAGRRSDREPLLDRNRRDQQDQQDQAEHANGIAPRRERRHIVEGRRMVEPNQPDDEPREDDPVQRLEHGAEREEAEERRDRYLTVPGAEERIGDPSPIELAHRKQ